MDLWRLGISDMLAGYRAGKFTPVDVFDSTLDRIAAANPPLNALVTLDPGGARAQAEASAARWRDAAPLSGIDGVCITVKDNIAVKGLRCTWGSRAYAGFVPAADETPVAHLRAAGVGILGKTNVPEFTLQGFTDNLVFGSTGNPWNPELTPGGSSGGAVACVASGMGVAAIGTDGGGSIRRPCAHTGLYGFKPSPGFVGRADGLPVLMRDFETMGVMARSPRDIREILERMARRHPGDRSSFAFSDADRRAVPALDGPLRVLFVPAFGDNPVDPEIAASVEAAAGVIEGMGHVVETGPVPFDIDELNDVWGLIGPAGLAWLAEAEGLDTALLTESLLPQIAAGQAAGAKDYVRLLFKVDRFRAQLAQLFEGIDVLMTPSVAALPWPRTQSHPATISGVEVGPRGHAIFTPFANAGGLPAVNVPTRPSSTGLPIGAQFVGGFGSDLTLLALAIDYEGQVGPYAFPEL